MPKAENNIEEGLNRQDSNLRKSILINHNPNIQVQRNCNMKKCCTVIGISLAVTMANIYISYLMYTNSHDGSGC